MNEYLKTHIYRLLEESRNKFLEEVPTNIIDSEFIVDFEVILNRLKDKNV